MSRRVTALSVALSIELLCPCFALTHEPHPAAAGEVEYAKPISNRLNTTGRAIDIEVPLKDGERPLGDIVVRLRPDDTLLVDKSALHDALSAVVDRVSIERLEWIAEDDGFISLEALNARGFAVTFDRGLQELVVDTTVDDRASSDIALPRLLRAGISSTVAEPAHVSGYINFFASLHHQWDEDGAVPGSPRYDAETSAGLALESAVRIGGFVFENSGIVAGAVDTNVCPPSGLCVYDHTPGLKRQMTRLVYDRPQDRVRFAVGDVEPLGTSFQRTPDLLGFSVEKSGRKLNPTETLGPTGNGSFRVDHASEVEVLVNGVSQAQLQLRPGIYNIRDLPLVTGANDAEIVITDHGGSSRTLAFSSFFNDNLLAAGKSEWGITAGVPSFYYDEAREYEFDFAMGSAFFRYGVTDDLTTDVHFQADERIAMGGAGFLMPTSWGLAGARVAASASSAGPGAALGFDWSLSNFKALTGERRESARVFAEYRTPNFLAPGEIVDTATGIIYPHWNSWLHIDSSYSLPIGWDTTATLSGRYQFIGWTTHEQAADQLRGDRYGADVTLSRQLSPEVTANLTVGVSNEYYNSGVASLNRDDLEIRAALHVFVRPDDYTSLTVGVDTINQHTDSSFYRSEGNGLGRWDTSVNVQQSEFDGRTSISGSASYYGNRGQIRVAHYAGFSGVSFKDLQARPGAQLTSVQVGAGLAFADGHVAVGAPVTGDAFAIVYPHVSLANSEVLVGTIDNVRAMADDWGPALVSSVPAYTPSTIPIDVSDVPIGYSLGAGTFDTFAPFKAGYALEVGSAYSVSAYGTLLLADNEPVSLRSGVARSLDHPHRQLNIFTNAAGRFGAEGLAPGRWAIQMATDGGATAFVIDIPEATGGIVKLGTLHPAGTLQ